MSPTRWVAGRWAYIRRYGLVELFRLEWPHVRGGLGLLFLRAEYAQGKCLAAIAAGLWNAVQFPWCPEALRLFVARVGTLLVNW